MNVQLASAAFQDDILAYSSTDNSIATLNVPQRRVRISQTNSPWMNTLEERFNSLVSLPIGWDGYQGRPVSFSCAQFAAQIVESLFNKSVSAPSIVPGSDGSLQIEWHVNGYDIELDVLAPLRVSAFRYDHSTGNEEEVDVEDDFTQIAEWIANLAIEREMPIRAQA